MSITGRRSFLFLQGNATNFFATLGVALAAQGHAVHRVNFNGGDLLFWRLPGAVSFRGAGGSWPAFLEDVLDRWAITDILLFGDCRPGHRLAIAAAARRGIATYRLDEGYLRPNWITFEPAEADRRISLPCRPDELLRAAAGLADLDDGVSFRASFARRSWQDVVYHLARLALAWRFPHYRFHAPVDPLVQYGGWIGRILKSPIEARRSRSVLRLSRDGRPYFLVPMQLDCDYQVRMRSPFGTMGRALKQIIGSFAYHAPAESRLVIKAHPLDNGLLNWRRMIEGMADAANVPRRVVYLAHRDLTGLIARADGVITINSTVGPTALKLSRPVIALGHAVYDIEGLTFQGGLDRFWREASPPCPILNSALRRVLLHQFLVRGSFYNRVGVARAVAEIVERLGAINPARPISPAGDPVPMPLSRSASMG